MHQQERGNAHEEQHHDRLDYAPGDELPETHCGRSLQIIV
jgi:hypothetical protein